MTSGQSASLLSLAAAVCILAVELTLALPPPAVDHWLVKSGSSLRALAADLADYTKKLVESKPDGEGAAHEASAGVNGVNGSSSH